MPYNHQQILVIPWNRSSVREYKCSALHGRLSCTEIEANIRDKGCIEAASLHDVALVKDFQTLSHYSNSNKVSPSTFSLDWQPCVLRYYAPLP
jgi:hypothetical protein